MSLTALIGKKVNLFSPAGMMKRPPSGDRCSTHSTCTRLGKSVESSDWVNLVASTTIHVGSNHGMGDPLESFQVDMAEEPDLSSVYATPRFFVSSPGWSNSILCSASGDLVEESYSLDPYSDFRRSMEEMVDAHQLNDVFANWGSLGELLGRYLSLNPESNHKFIAAAFADLLVSLLTTIRCSCASDRRALTST